MTSTKAAETIPIAPNHCMMVIVSSGSKIDAVIMATITSDIIKILTRPGNNICDTLNITINPGDKMNMDQIAAVGKEILIFAIVGNGSI